MNLKYSVIIILIVLIVISIQTEFTEEQRYCDALSGQSGTQSASENYLICEKATFCKPIKHTEKPNNTLNAASDVFSFSCVHSDTDETIHPQKLQTLQ